MYKQIIKKSILGILLLFSFYKGYELNNLQFWNPKYLEKCGIVTFKGDRDQIYKYSSKTEFILVIDFSKIGDLTQYEEVQVDAVQWSHAFIGKEFCYSKRIHPSSFTILIGAIGTSFFLIISLFSIGYCLWWLIK